MIMQSMSEKPKRRGRPPRSPEADPVPAQEVVDRLEGLLPEDALQDALKGLTAEEITGSGGPYGPARRAGHQRRAAG